MTGRVSKSVSVIPDEFTALVSEAFDYQFDGTTVFTLPEFGKPDAGFRIGLIIGSSGSGKTSILREHYGYSSPVAVEWQQSKAILSHFSTPSDAVERCFAVGLGSIPTLCKPFHVLSNGEQYRAVMARLIGNGMVLDEFTSVVNRETAKSLCVAMRKFIHQKDIQNVVLASCHNDIIPFLQPDWVFDCDSGLYLNGINPPLLEQKIAEVSWYV